jgi:hypothetical protein
VESESRRASRLTPDLFILPAIEFAGLNWMLSVAGHMARFCFAIARWYSAN